VGDSDARLGELGAGHCDARINKHRRHEPHRPAQALTGQRIMIRDGKAVIVEPEAV
jgi:transposase